MWRLFDLEAIRDDDDDVHACRRSPCRIHVRGQRILPPRWRIPAWSVCPRTLTEE
jgi:hypothetical protein